MASSFNVFKINGNILTVNGVDYALDVVETGLASTSNSSFGTIKAIDNGDDTITLTINDKMLIVNKHVDYDGVLMTFNDEILVEDGGLALEVSEEVSLISFGIREHYGDSTPVAYQAEQGMTWAEWCNSQYNTNNDYYVVDGKISSHYYGNFVVKEIDEPPYNQIVLSTDYIANNGIYAFQYGSND